MPCNPFEYPQQTEIEKEIVKILYIQDELVGKIENYSFGHPRTSDYEMTARTLSKLTVEICSQIQNIVEFYKSSDRLQDWWINHKFQDHKRLQSDLKNSNKRIEFINELNNYDRETLDIKELSFSILINRVHSTNWSFEILKSEENINRVTFIYERHFLRTCNVLYALSNLDKIHPLSFNDFEIKLLCFDELLFFFDKRLNVDLDQILDKKEFDILKEAITINNLHSEFQKTHRGSIVFNSTLEDLKIDPLEKSFFLKFDEVIRKISLQYNIALR
ncbi:hypothetical protein [Dokdonia sp. Asnod1-B02]|uniref:hypothetical protein n=1 Tax=Dokdonia sp. Asnod1-B02 TaxID=3160573 RepID=UPI0038649266